MFAYSESMRPRPKIVERIDDDILQGAAQIARFLFGSESDRRRVYFLVESGALPHFRLGGTICARKSTLVDWIENQEARSCQSHPLAEAEGV